MRKRIIALALGASLLTCLCSCSAASKPERVSDEELASLREQYPYDNRLSNTASYDFSWLQDWEDINELGVYAVVALELKGDWITPSTSMSPVDSPEEQLPSAMTSVTGIFHAAEIERVLWGGADLLEGQEIAVYFGATMMYSVALLEETYQSGGRYVCFLFDARDSVYGIENAFSTGKTETFYLTDDDVLIASSDLISCIDACSGMYLDPFAATLTTVLLPDAEIDDPTTQLETE